MRSEAVNLLWPAARLGEGLDLLLQAYGFRGCRRSTAGGPAAGEAVIGEWLTEVMPSGLEVEALAAEYHELDDLLVGGGPMVARVEGDETDGFFLILPSRGRRCRVIGPDHRILLIGAADLRGVLCASIEGPVIRQAKAVSGSLSLARRRRRHVERALLTASLGKTRVEGFWIVRLDPGHSIAAQVKGIEAPARLAAIVGCHVLQYTLVIGSWWLIGRGVLEGRFDGGWLLAWALMLASLALVRIGTVWIQGSLSIDLGEILKLCVLRGLMRLELDKTRVLGAGKYLGLALESSAVQDLVLDGGYLVLLGSVEIILTAGILSTGAGGFVHSLAFVIWVLLLLLFSRRLFGMLGRQTETRLRLTDHLVESIVGHRTRLAQDRVEGRHDREDELLNRYQVALAAQDRWAMWTEAAGLGWQIVAVTILAPAIAAGASGVGRLAVAVGGIILGARALTTFANGIGRLGEATLAWRNVRPIFQAAEGDSRRGEAETSTDSVSPRHEAAGSGAPAIVARGLTFRGEGKIRPMLPPVNFEVGAGERVFLLGASGSGKSTVAALLAALRLPDAGVVLVNGLDSGSSSPRAWAEQIVVAPQFGENHVFSESFAFNLLMGRGWPPSEEDLLDAGRVATELGLGELLDTMPLGIHQIVGDSGWQLSHGERSRLFVARALLQGADIVVLDESLGPLDAESRSAVVECAERHSRTLLVIAHP